jgi:hypothetical protein
MQTVQVSRLVRLTLALIATMPGLCLPARGNEQVSFTVTPAGVGRQIVRTALPLPRGFLRTNQTLVVAPVGGSFERAGLRVLSWHPAPDGSPRTARRAMVTFPHEFSDLKPVEFIAETARQRKEKDRDLPVTLQVVDESFKLEWKDGRKVDLKLIAPARVSSEAPRLEVVEENACYRWQRLHLPDPQWPRVIEFRFDVAGGVAVVAHLQRGNTNDNYAPDLGWELVTAAKGVGLQSGDKLRVANNKPLQHSFADGAEATCRFENRLSIYHPTAPLKRRGGFEVVPNGEGVWTYRYVRCKPEDKVPMQPFSWQRAEMVIAPPGLAKLTSSLTSPHRVEVETQLWSALYDRVAALPSLPPTLEAVARYHRDAIIHSVAVGDEFGNVTEFTDGSLHGGNFGMNRLNHGAAIFEGGWRNNDRRLTETGLLWCDNFYDQTIWWGEPQRGGTRYNNWKRFKPVPTETYMWRSDSSVSFCTKGYDCFWLAWEETGDPRMFDAYQAQTDYVAKHLHVNTGECRNIGDVRDFIRLYEYTGERVYLDEALRLFRELRTKLSTGHLFDQGGKPIDPDPPFIEEDSGGTKVGYAKPYIIGYALAGLPELLQYAPNEPDLKETVRAVADFLARTVDPAGGWRYPHPNSSLVSVSTGMENAWQLTQAARALGPDAKWLDAMEIVLRARIHGWQRTGKVFNGLQGWEYNTGKATSAKEIYELYKKPADRDASRDYREGRAGFGGAPPEGIVYFEEVLGFYLQHRPAARLLAEPKPDEPLGQILARSPEKKP